MAQSKTQGLPPAAGAREDVIVVDGKGGFADDLEKNAIIVDDSVLFDNASLTTYVSTIKEGKTEQQIAITKEYVHAAKKNVYDFVKKIYSLQNKNVASKLNLDVGKVTAREAADINKAVGTNVNGYKRNINGSTINHISERHGINGQQDNSMADINDIARIEYVVENYDSLDRLYDKNGNVVQSGMYKNFDQAKSNVIVYKKRVDGTYYVVEAVPDNNSKTLQVISAYIQKNKSETPQVLNMSYDPQLTSKPPLEPVSPYAPNIPQQQNLVNSGKMAEKVSVQREPLRFAGTGEVASDKANDVLSRLAKGEKVSVEELNAIPEVALARNIKRATLDTSKINTQERKALRKKVAETVNNYGSAVKTMIDGKPLIAYNGDIRQDKRADIVIGLPASGKSSTLVDPLSEKYKARVVDSDMVKELLPEFDNGYGAGVVHEESKGIANDWLDSAVLNGDNIVYPIVGSDITKVLRQIEAFKKAGYTVNLHLNELPNEKATGRMLKRFFTDNRFLDPNLMSKYGNKPTQVYNAIKELEGYIDGYSRYSNDVEYGQEPKLVETSLLGTNDRGNDGGRPRTGNDRASSNNTSQNGTGKVTGRGDGRNGVFLGTEPSQASTTSTGTTAPTEIKYTSSGASYGENTVGAAQSNPDSFYALTNRYGTIKPGERPARDVDVPTKSADGKMVSNFARTAMEARAVPDGFIEPLEDMIAKGELSHEVITDKSALNYAERIITRDGWQIQEYQNPRKDCKQAFEHKNTVEVVFYGILCYPRHIKTPVN